MFDGVCGADGFFAFLFLGVEAGEGGIGLLDLADGGAVQAAGEIFASANLGIDGALDFVAQASVRGVDGPVLDGGRGEGSGEL